MKAIRVERPGGPEALVLQEVEVPQPGPGEARVRIQAIGVNFIDIYHRTGLYPLELPFTPGSEASGVVDAVGEGVTEVKPGDRVAYAMHRGSYAEYAVVPARLLAPLPAELSFQQGAAAMLQGLTAHYLSHSTFPIKPGHKVLVHAAAGGVGLLLVQMAKALGATVFGTVSTREKAELAKAAGADHVILYTEQDFVEAVKELTGGEGLDCVYDSVGKETFHNSLKCLRPRGCLALFGQSSGPVLSDRLADSQQPRFPLRHPAVAGPLHPKPRGTPRADKRPLFLDRRKQAAFAHRQHVSVGESG